MRLSLVVPVYNGAQTITQVLDRVDAIDLPGVEVEVVVVDDGSTDGSAQIIAARMRRGGANRVAHLSIVNLGKGAAPRVGVDRATGDVVVVQDADLELDPAEIGRLARPLLDGRADVVYGSRFLRPSAGIPLRTRWANHALTWLTNVVYGARLTDMETAYKAFRREVLQAISLRCVGFDVEPEITARVVQAGYRIHEVPVSYSPRRPDEGKKIAWTDGLDAVYTLVRCRLVRQKGRPAARPAAEARPATMDSSG